jgi:hypothetical protein
MEKHISPKYYGYRGGFDRITKFGFCGRTALYEDQHPVRPCADCGNRILEFAASDENRSGRLTGKWVKSKKCWMTPREYEEYKEQLKQEPDFSVEPPAIEYDCTYKPEKETKYDFNPWLAALMGSTAGILLVKLFGG